MPSSSEAAASKAAASKPAPGNSANSAKVAKSAKSATSRSRNGQRDLPQVNYAEQEILGQALVSFDSGPRQRDVMTVVAEHCAPEDFFREIDRRIMRTAVDLFISGRPVDPVAVYEALQGDATLESAGGFAYLKTLIEERSQVTLEGIAECARIVHEKAEERRRIHVLDAAIAECFNGVGPREASDKAVVKLREIADREALQSATRFCTDLDLDERLGRIEWLWPGWVLKGFVTALVGSQEGGKSNIALDLCQRIMRGQPWPDGTPTGLDPDSRLLWIDTEMALAGFLERIQTWGLPRGRFVLPPDPLRQLQLDSPDDWNFIEGAIARFRPPLIVIDSLSGGHSGEEKDNDFMKGVLLKLSLLAQTHKIAVLVIHHLRKNNGLEPDWPITLDRVRGASAITQFCRSVLALGIPDKTQEGVRRLDVIKSNFARKPVSLGYEITDSGLAWGKAPEPPRQHKPIEAARVFLMDELEKGPRPSQDVFDAAEGQGICSRRTLETAITDLKLRRYKEQGRDGRWFIALPGYTPPPEEER